MKMFHVLLAALIILLVSGCSSTNLNAFRTEWTGMWVKGNPMDTQTPGKIEVGAGYGSVSIVPMTRGQGAKFVGVTYELFSGHPLFAEEVTVYPLGQDAVLKLTNEPESVIKIPWLIDIKAVRDPNVATPTKVEVIPAEKK